MNAIKIETGERMKMLTVNGNFPMESVVLAPFSLLRGLPDKPDRMPFKVADGSLATI